MWQIYDLNYFAHNYIIQFFKNYYLLLKGVGIIIIMYSNFFKKIK